jgi:hypothetical protein
VSLECGFGEIKEMRHGLLDANTQRRTILKSSTTGLRSILEFSLFKSLLFRL